MSETNAIYIDVVNIHGGIKGIRVTKLVAYYSITHPRVLNVMILNKAIFYGGAAT